MNAYLTPVMEIVAFDTTDVIETSNPVAENEPGVFAAPTTDYDMF